MRTIVIGMIGVQAAFDDTRSQLQCRAARRRLQRLEIELIEALAVDPRLQFLAELSRQTFGERGFF